MIVVDSPLLDRVSAEARTSPRLRKNFNFHPSLEDPCQRLLNAIEPGSYIRPHRHLAAGKDEAIVVLRGRLGVLEFDDAGRVTDRRVLDPARGSFAVDLPAGSWHTFVSLAPGTVFFEAKAGPYRPLGEGEGAPWAPAEGEDGVASLLARLESLLSRD